MIHSLADLYNKIINTRDHESLRSRPLVFLALATESLPAEGQDTFWGALQGFLRGLTHAHHLGPPPRPRAPSSMSFYLPDISSCTSFSPKNKTNEHPWQTASCPGVQAVTRWPSHRKPVYANRGPCGSCLLCPIHSYQVSRCPGQS